MRIQFREDAPVLIEGDTVYDAQGFYERVLRNAQGLKERGVGKDDSVVFCADSSGNTVSLFWGILARGAVACPLNPKFPQAQLKEMTRQVDAKLVISSSDLTFEESLGESVGDLDPERRATVIFTSGSSGKPKPAVHSFRNHFASATAANRNMPLGPGDRWLLSLPLYHVAGIGVLFRCMVGGATVVVPESDESIAKAIERYEVTHLSLVSTQLHRLLEDEESAECLAGLKGILIGGSAMPESLIRTAHERGLPIVTSYGMTETSTQIAATRPGDGLEELFSSGKALRDNSVSISDGGEILVKGPSLFQGYLEEDGTVSRPLDEGGWFSTRDLGHLDEEGYLHVTGRKDNMFVSGGENIQPEEIERALCALPGIVEAIVVPVEDAEFGNRPVAYVRLEKGEELRGDEIRTSLRSVLPGYKIPERVVAWQVGDEGEMKIDRKEVQTMARRSVGRLL